MERKKELGLLIGGSALLAASAFIKVERSCPCDPSRVNGIDRKFAGDRLHRTASKTSDILNGLTWTTPFLLDYLDARRSKQGSFRNDALVMAEAFILNQAATEITKKVIDRPRPFVYGLQRPNPLLDEKDSYLSFYSGHTSSAFAIGMSYAKTYARRHPGGRKALVYGLAIGIATTTGALRVGARKHFPTDVLVGAGTGIAFGLIVPDLH